MQSRELAPSVDLDASLGQITQQQCDAVGDRLSEVAAGLAPAAREAAEAQSASYDVPLNFTKLFTIMSQLSEGDLQGKTVLDVGCGGGGFMSQALGLGMEPTGVDIYSGQSFDRSAAERLLTAAGLTEQEIAERVLQADITEPVGSLEGRFDFAVSVGMLEHVPEKRARMAAVANMIRVLKPGGVLLLQCAPNSRAPLDLFHYGPRFPFYHQLPAPWKRRYMRRIIVPLRPGTEGIYLEPEFLTGVPVREIETAMRSVDPEVVVSRAFPLLMRLSVSRQILRNPIVRTLVGAISRLLTALKMEPVILIVAQRRRQAPEPS